VPAVAIEDPKLEGLKHVCALDVVIGADGVPGSMEIVNKTTTPFDESAMVAIRQSQFEPGSVSGKPVPVRLMVWAPFFGKDHPALPVAGTPIDVKELKPPKPTNNVEAQFSDEARQRHQPGRVIVRILVTEEGLPVRARILVHAPYGLDEQALAAVAQYRFRPALLEGVPVPMPIIVEVNFQFSPF
jgi:TonB family protein